MSCQFAALSCAFPHCFSNVEAWALGRPIHVSGCSIVFFFYPGIILLYLQCVWDHCLAEKYSRCESDALVMVYQNLKKLFCIHNSDHFEKITNITDLDAVSNHDRASNTFYQINHNLNQKFYIWIDHFIRHVLCYWQFQSVSGFCWTFSSLFFGTWLSDTVHLL